MNQESAPEGVGLRPEIALGWRRSLMSGLDQGMEVKEPRLFEVDRHSRLVRAADPVLTSMVGELGDTRFSILLADHSARIIDRRLSRRGLDRQLDRVKAIPGAQYVEELSGTNALATAFELRTPIAVAGDEHYLEALRMFCCYGAPIVHPITRRLEGVIDVTGPVADQSNLLGPFLMRAVRDIEQRLLEGARRSEQRLFAQFQNEAARSKSAVMLFGEDLSLSNAAAADLITTEDSAALRVLAGELGPSGRVTCSMTLTSGREVEVHARLADEGRDGVLIEVSPQGAAERRSDPPPLVTTTAKTVFITGPPGAGRTTEARRHAGDNAVLIDCAALSAAQIRSRITRAVSETRATVIDNVHFADATTAALIRRLLPESVAPVVLVSAPTDQLSDDHQALAAAADTNVELPALRDAGHSFAQFVRTAIDRLALENGADRSGRLRVTPSAVEVLADQDWPGNLAELERVLRLSARGRTSGDLTVADLPNTHRQRPARTLSRLERAERSTIIAALEEFDGNKKLTATALGIGRSTLYQRLRYYQIRS